jgi:hypothetical protein
LKEGEKFRRDGWARPWPVGVEMLCYMLFSRSPPSRQVCMLAHQLGFPLPKEVVRDLLIESQSGAVHFFCRRLVKNEHAKAVIYETINSDQFSQT